MQARPPERFAAVGANGFEAAECRPELEPAKGKSFVQRIRYSFGTKPGSDRLQVQLHALAVLRLRSKYDAFGVHSPRISRCPAGDLNFQPPRLLLRCEHLDCRLAI